ncbi:MAG TPA: UPF0158 family protein [Actinomycetota bacterium]
MDFREWWAQMRGAAYRGDGAAIVGLLGQNGLSGNVLQLAGEGLLAAVAQGVEGARDLAALSVKRLRDRDWYGDGELADLLEGLLAAAMPSLRPLPVDLDELAGILEGDPQQGAGGIDLETGEVWPQFEFEYAETVGEPEPQRWLLVGPEGTQAGYHDMQMFIGALTDPALRDLLQAAIERRDAFGDFEDILADRPDVLDQWQAFSEDRKRGRTRSWLAAAGYCPAVPEAPRL